MKALTIWQPWASLIATGVKRIETRSWATHYRGQLAIHAAVTDRCLYDRGWGPGAPFVPTPMASAIPGLRWRFDRMPGAEMKNGYRRKPTFLIGEDLLPLGAVVATCRLVDVVPILRCPKGPCLQVEEEWGPDLVPESELPWGDYTPGRYAWLLADVRPTEPTPAKGRQGLWEWHG